MTPWTVAERWKSSVMLGRETPSAARSMQLTV